MSPHQSRSGALTNQGHLTSVRTGTCAHSSRFCPRNCEVIIVLFVAFIKIVAVRSRAFDCTSMQEPFAIILFGPKKEGTSKPETAIPTPCLRDRHKKDTTRLRRFGAAPSAPSAPQEIVAAYRRRPHAEGCAFRPVKCRYAARGTLGEGDGGYVESVGQTEVPTQGIGVLKPSSWASQRFKRIVSLGALIGIGIQFAGWV